MANLYNCTIEQYIEKQYVGEQKIDKAYFNSQEKLSRNETQELDMQKASLAKYIPEPDRVDDIASQLATVKCALDFKMVVHQILDMYMPNQKSIIKEKPFRNALMPFVKEWHPTDDAVYRQCLEIFNE